MFKAAPESNIALAPVPPPLPSLKASEQEDMYCCATTLTCVNVFCRCMYTDICGLYCIIYAWRVRTRLSMHCVHIYTFACQYILWYVESVPHISVTISVTYSPTIVSMAEMQRPASWRRICFASLGEWGGGGSWRGSGRWVQVGE